MCVDPRPPRRPSLRGLVGPRVGSARPRDVVCTGQLVAAFRTIVFQGKKNPFRNEPKYLNKTRRL